MNRLDTRTKLATNVVGNIGMYFAAYQLSRRGWNVMPTSRNARGIDLLAYDSNARTHLGIQIKTLSKKKGAVPLGIKPLDHLMGDWWVIVTNLADDEVPQCFILKPDQVREWAVRDKGGPQAYWLPWANYSQTPFNWDSIGRGDDA